jgi:hypothetical protein
VTTNRTIGLLFVLFLTGISLFYISDNSSATVVNVDITINTTWSQSQSPYIVDSFLSSIKVVEGVTLTISPGVTVLFTNRTGLIIEGLLFAEGTTERPVVFDYNGEARDNEYWGSIQLDSSGNRLDYCLLTGCYVGIKAYEPDQRITNCEISMRHTGVTLGWFVHDVHLENLTISGFNEQGGLGVNIDRSGEMPNITLLNISCSNVSRGFIVDSTDDLRISNLTVRDATYGGSLRSADNVTLIGLVLNNISRYGIYSTYCGYTTVVNSLFINVNITGLVLGIDSTVIDCVFEGNGLGLELGSRNQSCTRCTFRNNDLGLEMSLFPPKVWWNNFIGNTVHAVNTRNDFNGTWDNGTHGNFWDNHTTPDIDRNGIVDNPFYIDDNDIDRFPLTEMIDFEIPIANCGLDRQVLLNEEMVFDGTNSTDNTGIMSYVWRILFDEGTIELHGQTVGYSFSVLGNFTVELEVMDGWFNIDRDRFNIRVVDVNAPVFLPTTPWNITSKERALWFNASLWSDDDPLFPTGANFTYVMEDDEGTYSGHGHSTSIELPNRGVYNLTSTAVDRYGNLAIFEIEVVFDWRPTNAEPPSVDAGEDIEAEIFSNVSLTGTFTPGLLEVVGTRWDVPAEPPYQVNGQTISFTPDSVGSWELKFTAWDYMGNEAEDTVWVAVLPRSPIVELVSSFPTPVSGNVTIEGTASGDVDIQRVQFRIDDGEWILGEGTSVWSADIDPTWLEAGSHTFEVRAWDGYNHGTFGPIGFTVYFPPEDPDGGGEDDDSNLWVLIITFLITVFVIIIIILYVLNKKRT